MKNKHFSLIMTLTVIASLLALTLGIAATNIINRERARQTAQVIASATATAVATNIIIVDNEPIRLEPDPNRYVTLGGIVDDGSLVAPGGDFVEGELEGGEPPAPTAVPTAAAPTPMPQPTRDTRPVIFREYIVQQGDSLYSVAEKMNSSIELMAKHGISEVHMNPGTVIEQLPYANPDYCPGLRAYVVRDREVRSSVSPYNSTQRQKSSANLTTWTRTTL
jgi:hypothetical protein